MKRALTKKWPVAENSFIESQNNSLNLVYYQILNNCFHILE